jgi:hypothetical protein
VSSVVFSPRNSPCSSEYASSSPCGWR